MTFRDIFKSGFMENMTAVSMLDMVTALALAFLLGLYIFFIYRKTYSGVMYSPGFGVTLIGLALITTMLIMTVASNVVLSLGMVGALSIVRFRAAIKEPVDILFLFWSIAVGIVLAAGLIPLAVFGSIFIGIVLLLFASKKTPDTPYILIIHCEDERRETETKEYIKNRVKKMNLKSKSVSDGIIELNYEVRLIDDDSSFVNELQKTNGVSRVVLVSYNGDYMV